MQHHVATELSVSSIYYQKHHRNYGPRLNEIRQRTDTMVAFSWHSWAYDRILLFWHCISKHCFLDLSPASYDSPEIRPALSRHDVTTRIIEIINFPTLFEGVAAELITVPFRINVALLILLLSLLNSEDLVAKSVTQSFSQGYTQNLRSKIEQDFP